MSDSNHSPTATAAIGLAEWIECFSISSMSIASLEHTRLILLDSLACASHAGDDNRARAALNVATRVSSCGDCTLIGVSARTSLPMVSVANGILIRTLDLNDTYTGPRQIGHPSVR
jgi:2-methylcitrate dehydratase PrpD